MQYVSHECIRDMQYLDQTYLAVEIGSLPFLCLSLKRGHDCPELEAGTDVDELSAYGSRGGIDNH